MLQQLAAAAGLGTSDLLRQLIRDAYKKQLAKMQTRSGFGFALGGLSRQASKKPPAKKPRRSTASRS